jgi:hypothetical protein
MSRITELYDKGRAALAKADASGWEAADAMAELQRLGQSQREIAQGMGCSQATVSRYLGAVSLIQTESKIRPPFHEARLEAMGGAWGVQPRIPVAPEKRAALAADLLKDKAVADAPQVRKIQERHTDRRFKEQARVFNREHHIQTQAEKRNEIRRTSQTIIRNNWGSFGLNVRTMARGLGDFTGELERTGLPAEDSGEIIRAVRALGRACDRFVQAATEAAIGRSS